MVVLVIFCGEEGFGGVGGVRYVREGEGVRVGGFGGGGYIFFLVILVKSLGCVLVGLLLIC